MQEINVNELKPHPKNDYFFDDIIGENWDAFLESIKTSGVIEPIIVDAKTKTIVSGHQRIRACKELGIEKVLCEVRIYDNEDKLTKDLLETNLRQRGIGNTNPIKLGRCLVELERIYGIHKGNHINENPQNADSKTQETLAKEIGISVDALNRYKKLTNLIPELQNMVEENQIYTTVASTILSKLSPIDQQQLILTYGKDEIEKATQKQTQEMVDEMTRIKNVNAGYELKLKRVNELEEQIKTLSDELDNRPTVEKTVEVVPDDYESNKKLLSGYEKDYSGLENEYSKRVKELNELKEQIRAMKELQPEEQYSKKLKQDAILYCAKVENFISQVGGLSYLSNHIKELPENEKRAYIKTTELVEAWAYNIKMNLQQYLED